MKIKGLILFLGLISILEGVSILKTDIPLVIGEGNVLNIFDEEDTKAQIHFSLVFLSEEGEYKVQMPKNYSSFIFGRESIPFSLGDNPDFDAKNWAFPFNITNQDTSKALTLNIVLPKDHILPSGTYSCFIPISIDKNGKWIKNITLEISFYVEEQLEAKVIVDGAKSQDLARIDFGQILGSQSKSLSLSIRSNKKVNLSAYSRNNGNLVLSENGDSSLSSCLIPYTLEKDEQRIKLKSSPTMISEDIAPNIRSILSNFKIKVFPEVDKNFAGEYEDRLVFSLSSS
jgi:hypothetical protein